MADTTTAKSLARKFKLFSHHSPKLKAGRYDITVDQDISVGGKTLDHPFPAKASFIVDTNRFSLNPDDVYKVFPPEGSLGDHSNVLPHIVLKRSTLPWERDSGAGPTVSWLALLLFDEREKPTPQVMTLAELQRSGKVPAFPASDLELRNPADQVTVIDIDASLAKQIQPTGKELEYLAHVQVGTGDSKQQRDNEMAIVICNRLPTKDSISTVHLVSVEGRYRSNGSLIHEDVQNEPVRFVSLKSWSFACVSEKQTFKELLKAVKREPGTLRLPDKNNKADRYLRRGMVPLEHTLRSGEQTASFYHGPLATGTLTTKTQLPVPASDRLLRFDPAIGMLDVSYAAAWQLGRLLALESKQFSIGLYNWKRTHVQCLKQAEQLILHPHLRAAARPANVDELPNNLMSWLDDLRILKGVPFNYLVPDERMLPQESIRFFQLDEFWIECLLDGAFSIGRVLKSDCDTEKTMPLAPSSDKRSDVTGFLLRSDVVSGWPGLLVDATDKAKGELKCLRTERLSANVFLCLFDGVLSRVALHLKPEDLHFGVDFPGPEFQKKLRDNRGEVKSLPWKRGPESRTLDIEKLATQIKNKLPKHASGTGTEQPDGSKSADSFSSADFALEMIEGVDMVEFANVE